MINFFSKKIFASIFLGIVFFLGGVSTASAADNYWAYQYRLSQGLIAGTINTTTGLFNFFNPWREKGLIDGFSAAMPPKLTSMGFLTEAACNDGLSKADHSYYTILSGCSSYTAAEIAAASASDIVAVGAYAELLPGDFTKETALDKFDLWCGLPLPTFTKYNLTDCIPSVIYYVIYKPASWFLIGTGYIFDAMLTLSIDSKFVNQDFITSSWTVVRDFSNMLFIFILLYTGIQTVFGIGNWRSTVIKVIIMALLINFSLFFTKVVIDAGNIFAVGIQSSMGTEKSATEQKLKKTGAVAERNISENLVDSFQPQRFLDIAGKVDALDATIVFLIASIVSGYAGYVFFKSALIFIGRLIAFWFLMIVSPFAFISIALPAKANKFQEWLDTLLAQAFVAPVFLFLIYIIMQVINGGNGILSGLMKQSGETGGAFTFDKVLAPVVIATLLIMALQQALKYAESMAGDFGKLGSQIGGAAMGIATGGTALAGRAVIGGLAAEALRRGYGGERTKALTQASFDVRNLGGKDSMFGATIGGGIAKGVGAFGVGKGGGVGGVEKGANEKIQKDLKKAKDKEMNVFEEQGVRARINKEAGEKEKAHRNAVAQKTQLQAEADAAKKAHNESQTAKDVETTGAKYEEAVADRRRGGSPEAVDIAKAAFDKAQSDHTSSPTSITLTKTLAKLEEAKKAEQIATEKAKESGVTPEKVAEAISKENTRRRNEYADKVEKGGLFGIGANKVAAAKIRKGEKPDASKKNLEKLLKEIANGETTPKTEEKKGDDTGH